MRVVGSIVQFIGGGIGRVALSGVLGVGVTLWQFAAQTIQHPPHLIANPWFSPSITLVGLVLIAASLWFNLWSRKQKTIDDLAEDMAWSVHNLLNRTPAPSTPEMIAIWKTDFQNWCDRVSKKLENRAFFTRADQLHFDVLGIMEPIAIAGHLMDLSHLETQLNEKLKRLRDIINWTQQRRR